MANKLYLPAVCKVKTTIITILFRTVKLYLPAVCKVKTTLQHKNHLLVRCICLLFAR